jgi:hypothetical protein
MYLCTGEHEPLVSLCWRVQKDLNLCTGEHKPLVSRCWRVQKDMYLRTWVCDKLTIWRILLINITVQIFLTGSRPYSLNTDFLMFIILV